MRTTTQHHQRGGGKRPLNRKERGMAMLLTMMLIMLVTATAMFGVQSTTFEMRSAGLARQNLQASYIAESGLTMALVIFDKIGPQGAMMAVERSTPAPGTTSLFSRYQPSAKPGSQPRNFRLTSSDEASMGQSFGQVGAGVPNASADAAARNTVFGSGLLAQYNIDVNDLYVFSRPDAGTRIDGTGVTFQYLIAVVTSAGEIGPTGSTVSAGETAFWQRVVTGQTSPSSGTNVSGFTRAAHRSQAVARGVFVLGPFARQ